MEIRSLTEAERKYTYTQSIQLLGQTGCIGHLRGDFDSSGNVFFTSWYEHSKEYNTDEFRKELDDVVNALHSDAYRLLQNQSYMWKYVREHPESSIGDDYCTEYGFRADTGKYSFLIRCKPILGDGNFYCYCYVTKWLDQHIHNAEKGIRFIDRDYNELFRIVDGEKIIITDAGGARKESVCRYIDEYHTEIRGEIFHISELAERMVTRGKNYEPKEGTRCLEPDTKKLPNKFRYHSEYGEDTEISLNIGQYSNNDRLAIFLFSFENGYPKPFGSLTVNIGASVPHYCGYLDINNLSNAESFVVENSLGSFTGIMERNGFCEYPLYLFNVDKLRKLCPQQMEVYERSIGVIRREPGKEKSR